MSCKKELDAVWESLKEQKRKTDALDNLVRHQVNEITTLQVELGKTRWSLMNSPARRVEMVLAFLWKVFRWPLAAGLIMATFCPLIYDGVCMSDPKLPVGDRCVLTFAIFMLGLVGTCFVVFLGVIAWEHWLEPAWKETEKKFYFWS